MTTKNGTEISYFNEDIELFLNKYDGKEFKYITNNFNFLIQYKEISNYLTKRLKQMDIMDIYNSNMYYLMVYFYQINVMVNAPEKILFKNNKFEKIIISRKDNVYVDHVTGEEFNKRIEILKRDNKLKNLKEKINEKKILVKI